MESDLARLGRPPPFDGTDGSWMDWSFQMRAYLSLLDQSIGPGLATAETESRDMIMLLDTDLPTTEEGLVVDSGAVAHVCPPSWALGLGEDLPGEDPQVRTA